MRIFDVDSHFEPTENWLDDFPELAARLPERFPESDPRLSWRSPEQFSFFTSFDLLRFVPAEERLSAAELTTPRMRAMYEPGPKDFGFEGAAMSPPMDDPDQRIAWMDEHGIAGENLISGTGYTFMRAVEDPKLREDLLSAVNTWMTDRASDYRGRFFPVTSLSYHDLDYAVAELTRMRGRGSRAFLFNAEPEGDLPPTDRAYDRLWAAACDLGMTPIVHVGVSPARFHPAWARIEDPLAIRCIAVSQPVQATQVMLTAMILTGLFERFPKLTFVLAELGIDWVVPFAFKLDGVVHESSPIGGYSLPLLPSEYVRRNVRVTPLPHADQSPLPTLEALPEVAIFSTDLPHFESNPDAMPHYEKHLAPLSESVRASFLGENILACYERMGQPIELRTTT